jgi:hypothetical protein
MTNNNNYAYISGMLSIVSGAFGALMGLLVTGMGILFYFLFSSGGMSDFETEPFISEAFPWIFIGIYGLMGLIIVAMGVLSIIGGAFALKKKHWPWALAGAIAGAAVFFYTGIAAVVLVSLAKSEFEVNKINTPLQEVPQEIVPPPAAPQI